MVRVRGAEIRVSATNSPHLVWDGPNVRPEAAGFLDPSPSLFLTAPAVLAGSYPVGTAVFGPSLQMVTVTGDLALSAGSTGADTTAALDSPTWSSGYCQ